MRRLIIICLAIFALIGVASAVLIAMAPDQEPAPQGQQLDTGDTAGEQTTSEPWSGAGVQELNTTFLVSGNQIIIRRFAFAGLDKPMATVEATLFVVPAQGKAGWLKNAFRLNNARRVFRPTKLTVTDTGKGHAVKLRFTRIPSSQLRGKVGFSVTYPSRDQATGQRAAADSFLVLPLAPSAPVAPTA